MQTVEGEKSSRGQPHYQNPMGYNTNLPSKLIPLVPNAMIVTG